MTRPTLMRTPRFRSYLPASTARRLAAEHTETLTPAQKKCRHEQQVLDAFCLTMRRRHRARFEACNRGQIEQHTLRVDGEWVDGLVRTATGLVAVEIVEYSPESDRGDVVQRDAAFRIATLNELGTSLAALGVRLSFTYDDEIREPRIVPYSFVKSVPRQNEWPAVLAEVRDLLHKCPTVKREEFLRIRFMSPEICALPRDHCSTLFDVDVARYPRCARHFQSIRLQGAGSTNVDSNMSLGYVGFHEPEFEDVLVGKAQRSLTHSTRRSNELPVWLLIHSDGGHIHTTIHETQRSDAIRLASRVFNSHNHAFDRVYWADRASGFEYMWIGRVPLKGRARSLRELKRAKPLLGLGMRPSADFSST